MLLHDTIQLRRELAAPVARVFDAWREDAALQKWCCPGDEGWTGRLEEHAFAIGGSKRIVFGPEGEIPYVEQSRYLDIVADEHIINSERILHGEILISVSKITLEFSSNGDGCVLLVTDQITLLGDEDSADARRGGWGEVLDKLQHFVA